MSEKLVDEGPVGQVVAGLLVSDDEDVQARADEGDDDVGGDVDKLDPVPSQEAGVEVLFRGHPPIIEEISSWKESPNPSGTHFLSHQRQQHNRYRELR